MTNPLQAGVDHAELRRLAEAATPGPWAYMGDEYADNGGKFYCVESADQETVFGEYGPGPEDARYVAAANPAVMVALLNEIEALATKNEGLINAAEARNSLLEITERELQALRAAPVLPDRGWRPIESAPRDGAWFQAWRTPPKMTGPTWEPLLYVCWDEDEQSFVWPDGMFEPFTVRGRELADMMISDGDFYSDTNFTHWMPLPDAPAEGAE